jgi:hypothetical protein
MNKHAFELGVDAFIKEAGLISNIKRAPKVLKRRLKNKAFGQASTITEDDFSNNVTTRIRSAPRDDSKLRDNPVSNLLLGPRYKNTVVNISKKRFSTDEIARVYDNISGLSKAYPDIDLRNTKVKLVKGIFGNE